MDEGTYKRAEELYETIKAGAVKVSADFDIEASEVSEY